MSTKLDIPHVVMMVGVFASIIGFVVTFGIHFPAALLLCLLVLAYAEGAYWQGRWVILARWVRSDYSSWLRDSGQRSYPVERS